MFLTTVSFIVVISAASGSQFSSNTDEIGNEIFNEITCLSVGGICIPAGDCPEGKRSQLSGLCPLQESLGIECCHSLPLSEKRCHQRGGICVDQDTNCPEKLTFKEARDCEPSEKCCILVH